jgi:hypothetical protein
VTKGTSQSRRRSVSLPFKKGPHWAAPLKARGDELVQQGNTKEALAKNDEAPEFAPNGTISLKITLSGIQSQCDCKTTCAGMVSDRLSRVARTATRKVMRRKMSRAGKDKQAPADGIDRGLRCVRRRTESVANRPQRCTWWPGRLGRSLS